MAQAFFVQQKKKLEMEKNNVKETAKLKKKISKTKNSSCPMKSIKQKCKPTRKYSNTKMKARSLLTNIAYSRLNKNDHFNKLFVTDTKTFLTKNFNPFSLGIKFNFNVNQQYIYMLWEKCVPNNFINLSLKRKILSP